MMAAADVLDYIRFTVTEHRHRLTFHAVAELANDRLCVVDAESALLTGAISKVEPDEVDNPGPRYTVVGKATDLITNVGVVCRFDDEGDLVIITCYQITA